MAGRRAGPPARYSDASIFRGSEMRCENCGTEVGATGHRCPYGRQVSVGSVETFAEAGRRVTRFAVVFAVAVLAVAGLSFAGLTAIRSGSVDPSSVGTLAGFALTTMVIGFIGWVGLLGLLVSTVVWIVSAHRITPRGPGAIGYGALVGFALLCGLSYVLPSRIPVLALAGATELVLRLGGLAVLFVGVMLVRTRLQVATGREIPAGRQPIVTRDDWDASQWDPEVQHDIERRRTAEG